MNAPIYQVDAFTAKTFGGNPAAVVPLPRWLNDSTLQNIAAENNLSETAFFIVKGNSFEIRWFTPNMEIDLCGHATLATAFVLFEHLHYKKQNIYFNTRYHGELKVFKNNDLIVLEFPSTPPKEIQAPDSLILGLGAKPDEVYESRDILAVFESEKAILSLEPEFEVLKALPHLGIIVTAPGEKTDFVSRFFAPKAGINEDPVTGSAHTSLIPFWAERLKKKRMNAVQLSARKGELLCEHREDKVWIGGNATSYLKGEITF